MRKVLFLFACLLTATFLLTTSFSSQEREKEWEPIFMELEQSVKYIHEKRPLQNPGKIYCKDNYIYVNELFKGVHVINNSHPANPVNEGFILVPGCVDMAVKENILYVDNAVAPKANLQGAGAVEVATVNAAGQYIRSGTALADLATTANVNTIVEGSIETAITNITQALEVDLDGKADKIVPSAAGNIAGLDATGNLMDSGVLASDILVTDDLQPVWENLTQIEDDAAASDLYFREEIRKNSELDSVIRDLIVNQEDANGDGVRDGEVYVVRDRLDKLEDGVDGAELVTNRVDAITDSTSATAYPSVAAIREYVLPAPPAECSSQQCVLSVNPGGEPYWEIVTFPAP